MRTPALRRRITLSGVLVLSGVLLVFDAFVYLSLRAGLEDALSGLLDARMEVAARLAVELEPAELAARLSAVGVPAHVRTPDGQLFRSEPATPRVGQVGPPTAVPHPRVERTVELPDGTTLTVFATRAGLDATLRRLVAVMAVGTLSALLLAGALWRRASAQILGPLTQMADTAEQITAGRATQPLDPDRPDTKLGRLAKAFDEMVAAQHSALRSAEAEREHTRRFLADAAHQLRTPMAGLRASAEQLLQEQDPQLRDRLLANVVRETARASRLVTALLRMEQLEHEQLRRVPTEMVEVCRQEAERARSLAPQLRIELDLVDPPDGPIEVDPDAIHDALGNLMDNARRHARTAVRLAVTSEGDIAVVRVNDDGPGIPAEDTERAFERFASLDGKGGSGLGLPIARGVARAHGGDLVYEGGAFVLRVPTWDGG
ncbi:MAG: HAMP domain-containing histidine kinase [Actinomycetota bacterium]|nr:HAMP domain-containing histidine kinase [Actinomycetota bacterium]